MGKAAVNGFDLGLSTLVNQEWRGVVLDYAMPLVSNSLFMWGLGCLGAVLAMRRIGGRRVILGFVVLLLAAGLSDLTLKPIKHGVGRVRPEDRVAGVFYRDEGRWERRPLDFVQTRERGSSFPSGHASNSMAVAVAAMGLWPGLRPWALLLPLIIGFSRIYLGKHFPTDVLAGWMIGAAVGYVLVRVLGWARRRWPDVAP